MLRSSNIAIEIQKLMNALIGKDIPNIIMYYVLKIKKQKRWMNLNYYLHVG